MNAFLKLAYDAGARQALIGAGLIKQAEEPKAEEESSFEPSLQTYRTDTPVPMPLTRKEEQIPGAIDIEIARRAALGEGDFQGETNLINFDEQLRNYDPGAYGEFARANYEQHAKPGWDFAPFLGGGRDSSSAGTRREFLDGRQDRWNTEREQLSRREDEKQRFTSRKNPTGLWGQGDLNRAVADPSYTSDDIRKAWKKKDK